MFLTRMKGIIKKDLDQENVLIYGAGESGVLLVKESRINPNFPYKIVGFLDDSPNKIGGKVYGLKVFAGLDKVKEIEEVEKNQIENIILKNSDDYDIKVWKIGRASSLLIGKRTPRNKVDIDVSEGVYSNLVSRAHGMLNRVNGVWYYEDLGSQNGSGIEKKDDRRKIKLKRNVPVKVESGDIIYLATTKILLK